MNKYLDNHTAAIYLSAIEPLADLGAGDFSLSFWCYLAANSVELFSDSLSGVFAALITNRRMYIQFPSGDPATPKAVGSAPLDIHRWQHIVLNLDRDADATMYVNCANKGGTSIAMYAGDLSMPSLFIGNAGGTPIKGCLDDFRIYKSLLTVAEIREIYNNGAGRRYAALSTTKVAAWACNLDGNTNDAVGVDNADAAGAVFNGGGVPFFYGSRFFRTNDMFLQRR